MPLTGTEGAESYRASRRSGARTLTRRGANVKAVQRMLGHDSVALALDVYSDLFDTDLDEVAARADAAWEALG